MYEVFISYTSSDEKLARFAHAHLTNEGLSTFLAPVSLLPGQPWSPDTLNALISARWVIFLASRAACSSPYVQQEIGAAIAGKKQLIPVIWDLLPSQLPGWASQYQALNLAGKSGEEVKAEMLNIASHIKGKKNESLIIAGLLLAGFLALG